MFCCCRSVKKVNPVWFSDVSGPQLGEEIYGCADTHLHTLRRAHLLPAERRGNSASLPTRPVLSDGAD